MKMSWFAIPSITFVTCITIVASERKGPLSSSNKVQLDVEDPGTREILHHLESLYHVNFGVTELSSATQTELGNNLGLLYEFEYLKGSGKCRIEIKEKKTSDKEGPKWRCMSNDAATRPLEENEDPPLPDSSWTRTELYAKDSGSRHVLEDALELLNFTEGVDKVKKILRTDRDGKPWFYFIKYISNAGRGCIAMIFTGPNAPPHNQCRDPIELDDAVNRH